MASVIAWSRVNGVDDGLKKTGVLHTPYIKRALL